MKKSVKSIKKWFTALFLFGIMIFATCLTCEAKEIASGKGGVGYYQNAWRRSFKTPGPGRIVLKLDYKITEKDVMNKSIKIKWGLADKNRRWTKESYDLLNGNVDKVATESYSDIWTDDVLPGGTYNLIVKRYNSNHNEVDFTYKILWFPDYADDIEIVSKVSLNTGDYKKIGYTSVPSNLYAGIKEIRSSNESILDVGWGRRCVQVFAKKAGKCKIYVTLINGRKKTINVTIKRKPVIQYTSCTLWRGEILQNNVLYTNQKTTWSSSNSSVASVSSTGKITAKSLGKCTITARNGSKKWTCVVNVILRNPNFGAAIKGYYTRDNYFEVRFRNNGDKDLIIYPYGAKAEEEHYKEFDRYLSLDRTYTIKPNSEIRLKFYVNGSTTWYEYGHFKIYYKFKYDEVVHDGWVSCIDSAFKKSDGWYNTYTNSYESWYKGWRLER